MRISGAYRDEFRDTGGGKVVKRTKFLFLQIRESPYRQKSFHFFVDDPLNSPFETTSIGCSYSFIESWKPFFFPYGFDDFTIIFIYCLTIF